MSPRPIIKSLLTVAALFTAGLLSACGSGELLPLSKNTGNNDTTGQGITLSMPSPPVVSWKANHFTTQLVMQFMVRDQGGRPLAEDKFDVQIMLDGKPVDVESLLNQSSAELGVNLYFAMVLDSSYSMTQHTPPAFDPMKAAASSSYQQVIDLWNSRPGKVKFSLVWFDSTINQSKFETSTLRDWVPADIQALPTPQSGSFTKLYSAVDVMTKHLQTEFDSGVFTDPRDRYMMLIFSDGQDNYSWTDTSALMPQLRVTTSGASYQQFGTAPTTLATVKQHIAAHPRLTTHVIGLGSEIDAQELQQLADAGHGSFKSNPDSSNISNLFDSIMKEFTTIQTRGAEIPLQPGEYNVRLQVRNKQSGETAHEDFRIYAGDANAKLLPAAP